MDAGVDETLAGYRSSIDNIDAALVLLLAERFKITKQSGCTRPASACRPADPQREQQQIARLRELAAEAHLDPVFSETFLRFVISEVIRHHDLARRNTGPGDGDTGGAESDTGGAESSGGGEAES